MGVLKNESNRARVIRAFALFGSIALSAMSCGGYVSERENSAFAVKPVPLVFSASPDVFPATWVAPPYSASARPLGVGQGGSGVGSVADPQERERVERTVCRGLAKYPTQLLENHLTRVVLVGSLEFSGIHAAGTNSSDTVYLACAEVSDDFIEETFHHEFSSILLRRNPTLFDARGWRALSPAGFSYGDSGVQAIVRGQDSLQYDDESNRLGFLHQYAQATLEDDFNSISEKLFMNEPEFWDLVEKHPGLAAKTEITISFYSQLDLRFDRAFFRRL